MTHATAKPTSIPADLLESGRGWISQGNHPHLMLGK